MLIFVKKDTPEAAIRSLVIQLSRQGIGTAAPTAPDEPC